MKTPALYFTCSFVGAHIRTLYTYMNQTTDNGQKQVQLDLKCVLILELKIILKHKSKILYVIYVYSIIFL